MRCFLAIPISDEVRGKLFSVQQEMKESETRMKLVEKENMHITLKFYGEIDEQRIEEIKKKMDAVGWRPFVASFEEVGAFPNKEYIKVIWAGIDEGAESISAIAELFVTLPFLDGAGFMGVEKYGRLVPFFIGLFNIIWGIFASFWLHIIDFERVRPQTWHPPGPYR